MRETGSSSHPSTSSPSSHLLFLTCASPIRVSAANRSYTQPIHPPLTIHSSAHPSSHRVSVCLPILYLSTIYPPTFYSPSTNAPPTNSFYYSPIHSHIHSSLSIHPCVCAHTICSCAHPSLHAHICLCTHPSVLAHIHAPLSTDTRHFTSL